MNDIVEVPNHFTLADVALFLSDNNTDHSSYKYLNDNMKSSDESYVSPRTYGSKSIMH